MDSKRVRSLRRRIAALESGLEDRRPARGTRRPVAGISRRRKPVARRPRQTEVRDEGRAVLAEIESLERRLACGPVMMDAEPDMVEEDLFVDDEPMMDGEDLFVDDEPMMDDDDEDDWDEPMMDGEDLFMDEEPMMSYASKRRSSQRRRAQVKVDDDANQDSFSAVEAEAHGAEMTTDDSVLDVVASRNMRSALRRLDRVGSYLEKHGEMKFAHRIYQLADAVEAQIKEGI